MTQVHCFAECSHRDTKTDTCGKGDIVIEVGGYCSVMAELERPIFEEETKDDTQSDL
jgi:hypothetical protein